MEHTAPPDPHLHTVRRAALPEVLFAEDVAIFLGRSVGAAREAIVRGDLGPYVRIGRRLAVRREAMLEHLEGQEVRPPSRRAPPPAPDGKVLALLTQGGRGRRGRP